MCVCGGGHTTTSRGSSKVEPGTVFGHREGSAGCRGDPSHQNRARSEPAASRGGPQRALLGRVRTPSRGGRCRSEAPPPRRPPGPGSSGTAGSRSACSIVSRGGGLRGSLAGVRARGGRGLLPSLAGEAMKGPGWFSGSGQLAGEGGRRARRPPSPRPPRLHGHRPRGARLRARGVL